jgi:hypothetical protein
MARVLAVRLFGHIGPCLADLLDHEIFRVVTLDNALDLRLLVPGSNEELPRMLSHASIGRRINSDSRRAIGVGAFAEELQLPSLVETLLQVHDVFVDLSEECLVASGPFLPQRRHPKGEVTRYQTWVTTVTKESSMAIRVVAHEPAGGHRPSLKARAANDRIAEKAELLRFVSRVPMRCECGAPECRTIVLISLDDYRDLRANPGNVLVARGHPRHGVGTRVAEEEYEVREASFPFSLQETAEQLARRDA